MTLPLAMGAILTSCVEDTQPRLDTPTEFVLNTPPMANQTYVFRDDANYKNLNDITFTVSQPNYGLGVTPTYTVQLAKSEAAFTEWDKAMADAAASGEAVDGNSIKDADNKPLALILNLATQQAIINIGGIDFCEGVNSLYGFDLDNYNHETVPVSVRVHAALPNTPQSEIWSNVVNLKVSSYIPVKEPGKLYLIGAPSGWDINNDKMYLEETGIGTKLFHGNLFIPEGQFQFRFYSQLGDWESFSVGSQDSDNPVAVTFNADGTYEGEIFMGKDKGDKLGKGSWEIKDWPGGNVEFTIDTKEMTITMQKAAGKKIYAIGNFQGWNIDKDNCSLEETPAGSNIYKGTFDVADPAGGVEFALYTELGNWDANFLGPEDGKSEFSVAAGPYIGTLVKEKRNFKSTGWTATKIGITADLNSNTITIEGL